MTSEMPTLDAILGLDVPLIVLICETEMSVDEVMAMTPGTIIELPRQAEDDLEVHVSDKAIGTGRAVKIGENFGVRINYVGDLRERIEALRGAARMPEEDEVDDIDPEAFASQLLAEQGVDEDA